MAYDVNNLMSWFKNTQHVNVSNLWLRQTVEEIKSQAGLRNCPLSRIQDEVWKKWLLTDLHLHPNSCLPKDLQAKTKQVVNGNFVLQIDEIRDISKPCYSQLMKITNKDEEFHETNEKSNKNCKKEKASSRVLKLNLSDGMENVFGMEYKPIPFLNTSIPPGSKIFMHGNFTCRLGIFLLTQENVRFLGGEVKILKEENTQDKVLARALGNDQILLNLPVPSNNSTVNQNINVNNEFIDDFDDSLIDFEEIERLENNAIQSSSNTFETRNMNFEVNNQLDVNNAFDDDDDFIDFNELERLEKIAVEKNSTKTSNKTKTRSNVNNKPNITIQNSAEKRKNKPSTSTGNSDNLMNDLWQDAFDDNFDINNFDVIPQAKKIQPPTKKPCLQMPSSSSTSAKSSEFGREILTETIKLPFIYLRNVLSVPISSRQKHCTIKGFFMTLTKALDHNCETKWSLEALVNDSTESLDVTIDNKVLEELIGFRANEVRGLSRRAKYDADIRKTLDEGLANCKTTLTNFTGLIDIEFSSNGSAIVVKIRDLTENDVYLIDLSIDDSLLPIEFKK